jgi:hypothetical protein
MLEDGVEILVGLPFFLRVCSDLEVMRDLYTIFRLEIPRSVKVFTAYWQGVFATRKRPIWPYEPSPSGSTSSSWLKKGKLGGMAPCRLSVGFGPVWFASWMLI